MIERPPWVGRTVICIASGPSLTPQDCERARESGHPVVITNTTFRLCPWADALFAFDSKWWRLHHEEVVATFKGRKFSASQLAQKYGAEVFVGVPWFGVFRNSGACAVSLAVGAGAARVILLGFDAGFAGGKSHWHGDHPAGLENCTSLPDWQRQFTILAKRARRARVEVINASRQTRLAQFPRAELEGLL